MTQMNKEFEDESPGLSLRELYFTIFRHQRLIVTVAAGAAVIAVIAALFFIKTTYESSADLLVRAGRESMEVDTTSGVEGPSRMRNRGEEIQTEMEIIKSREVIDAVVTSFGMDFFKQPEAGAGMLIKKFRSWIRQAATGEGDRIPTDREKQKFRDSLIDRLMAGIEVKPVKTSSLFRVSFQGSSPDFARDFLQRLIAVYLDKHSSMYFTDSSYMFINEKTDKFRSELEQIEKEITEFKNRASATLIQEERFLDQFATLEQGVSESESAFAASQAKVKVLREKLAGLPHASGAEADSSGAAADEILRRLSALRIREQELLSTYTDASVPVQEVRRQIREVQNMLPRSVQRPGAALPGAMSMQSREGLQLEMIAEEGVLSSLEARLAVQREKLAQLKEQYRSVNEDTLVLANLERKRAALEGSYKKFSENLQQARIDQSLKLEKISNITIAQHPTYSLQPLKTKKMVVLLGGVLGGILAAVGLAFFLESFDHTIRKPDDIQERLNMRCLVSLPEFETPQRMIPDMHELPNLTIVPERKKSQSSTMASKLSNTAVIKYFDALMQSLIFSDKEQPGLPYIIAVTSARSGEGVSTVAANLAMRLARLGHGRVLLADMNPMNLDHEGTSREPGRFPALGNMIALQGEKDAAGLPAVLLDRLFLMQYSGQNQKGTALGEMQSLWGKEYEFVVMDVPPVLNNEGASMIARLAHKVILVIQAERERWQVIRRAQEVLEEAHANVIGAILNKRIMYIPQWVYRRL
ncbi:MAG: hypothetical protein JW832_12270 [Deltaproteobacteria bacterium]|nr:hypothetical protein [Deltaproteobacteria bacterium]